jgi:hypothetical protein
MAISGCRRLSHRPPGAILAPQKGTASTPGWPSRFGGAAAKEKSKLEAV